jgi:hypothetical protein
MARLTNGGVAGKAVVPTLSQASGKWNTQDQLIYQQQGLWPPPFTTSGLALHIDAGDVASYSGTGSTWFDISGNSRNGTLANTTFTNSGSASYFNFNGSTSHVDLGQTAYVGSGTSPLTAEVWMFVGNTLAGGVYIMPIRVRQDSEFFVAIGDNAGTFFVNAVFRNSTQNALTSGISRSLFENQWVQLVVVYNGGNKSTGSSYVIYRNGVSLGTGSTNFGTAGGTANWNALGKDSLDSTVAGGTGAGALNGRISNYKLYDRALSPTEISQNFSALRSRYDI